MPSPMRLPIEEGRIQLLWLTNPNTSLVCDKLLSVIPGRRWVCLAHWGEQVVIARVFADYKDAQHELNGMQALLTAHIKAPALLYDGWTSDKSLYVILLEHIESAQDLGVVWQFADEAARKELLQSLVALTVRLHNAGLQQSEIRLKNFLFKDAIIYILNPANIIVTKDTQPLGERISLKNLALLFAQLPSRYDAWCSTLYPFYIKGRGLVYTLSGLRLLKKWINYWRRYQVLYFSRKAFCTNSSFISEQNWRHFSVCDRGYDTAAMHALLAKPDQVMQTLDVAVLKANNECVVSKVIVDGRALVVKHYNFKNIWQILKCLFGLSPAARCWRNAQRLRLLDIATPKPVAMLEKRFGPLCYASYFVAEYVAGHSLENYFSREDSALSHIPEHLTYLAENVLGLFADLADMQITHGNLTANNILLSQSHPMLLDLDAMHLHRSAWQWRRSTVRDRKRFMESWQGRSEALQVFRLIASEQNK